MSKKLVTRGDPRAALEVFAGANAFHLATTTSEGDPVLRTFHGVVTGGAVCFHGRRVVATAHRVVAEIPSYFVDPELACPATTYYVSAILRGTLVAIEDVARKARVLQAFMQRFQPEGGHIPITADNPMYRKMVHALMIGSIDAEEHIVVEKLGQNRSAEQMSAIVTNLWRRGCAGDLVAIETLLAAHPVDARPDLLRGPDETNLVAQPAGIDIERAVGLVRGNYWTEGIDDATLAAAHRNATAWVGARDPRSGELVATGRAVADTARFAQIMDVAVHPARRNRGIGSALVALLLDHPAVRRARAVHLGTRDAQGLYERLGFAARGPRHTQMILERPQTRQPYR